MLSSSVISKSVFESNDKNNNNNNRKKLNKKESIRWFSSNTLKRMNSLRTLPLIKTKSLNNWFNSNHNKRTDSVMSSQLGRRLSWFEPKNWSFRRGNKRNVKGMECWPDITIIFSKDAFEWNEYLTECFTQMNENHPLTILHERIDQIHFPLGNYETKNFCNSRAILLILSPDLLDFIDANTEVFQLTRLLNPKRTVVMLCGVQQQDITRFHKAALVSYDQWTCLVAKDQDKEFVVCVIQTVLMIIQQNDSYSSNKPQFKLTPRKVREKSGKVFILLDSPITHKQQIQILFDGSNDNQLAVKWKNPYTLYFIIPDDMLRVARVMNISLICDNKNFMGTRPLKCETRMSELHSLLALVNTPIEFMCQTLGYATLSQLDAELTARFRHKMPDFASFFHKDIEETKLGECFLPTLLHFAAAYGLRELTSKLLHCPLALKACKTRNSDNLTPAQLAHHFNHKDIGALLDDFQRLCETQKLNNIYDFSGGDESQRIEEETSDRKRNVTNFRYSNSKLSSDSVHHQLYGLKLYSDLLDFKQQKDSFVVKNKNNNKSGDQLNVGSEQNDRKEQINGRHFIDVTKCQSIYDSSDSESTLAVDLQTMPEFSDKNIKIVNNFETQLTNDFTIENSHEFNDIQRELIDIIEVFKEGLSFDKFELLFDKWHKKYCNVLESNQSKELHESVTQIKTLCDIGRKRKQLENNKNSLNFNDLRYYLSSKLDNKINDNNLKQTLHERLQLLSLNQFFCSDSLSSISSIGSSLSATNDNLIDDSNQSTKSVKPPFERNSHRYNQNNYYKRLKTKVISLVEKPIGSQITDKQSDSKPIKNSKPPAPPPRPLTVSPISKPNKANESIESMVDLNQSLYYNYQNDKKQKDNELEENLSHYSHPYSGKPLKDELKSKTFDVENDSTSRDISHHYVNMNSKQNESPVMTKRDPLIDYDLVPSGIPVPINALRAKAILSVKPLKSCFETHYDYDYDFPKITKLTQINDKIKFKINNCLTNDEKQESNLETENQIFV